MEACGIISCALHEALKILIEPYVLGFFLLTLWIAFWHEVVKKPFDELFSRKSYIDAKRAFAYITAASYVAKKKKDKWLANPSEPIDDIP